MNFLARKTMLMLGGGLVVALVIGLFTDTLGWCLFILVSVALGLVLREVKTFLEWSERPLRRPRNSDTLWDAATHRVYMRLQRDRTRTRDVLAQLRSLQTVTEALPDGAIVMGENGEIENLNRSATKLLNLSPRDKGRTLATLIRQPKLVALLKDGYEDNLVEINLPSNDLIAAGKQIEVRKFVTDDQRSALLVRDVTEVNRLLSMRQEFIANVSHELRTPLTVIVGYLETLQDEVLERDKMLDLIGRLRPPAIRMHALVDDLLLLTRLESAAPPAIEDLEAHPLGDILEQVISENQAIATTDHHFELNLDTDAQIYGIESELFSCFANLVANAVRYSPNGGTISVTWENYQDGACFTVADQGTGIAPEHLSRLTERFYRVDLTGARVRGGTGLGLAIVKHVLKRHNSLLTIESELGQGSRFTCTFPHQQLYQPNQPLLEGA